MPEKDYYFESFSTATGGDIKHDSYKIIRDRVKMIVIVNKTSIIDAWNPQCWTDAKGECGEGEIKKRRRRWRSRENENKEDEKEQ